MQISLLRFFKKINKFTLCVVLMQIFGYFISLVQFLDYFWLMQIRLMQFFSRNKSRIRQELSVNKIYINQVYSQLATSRLQVCISRGKSARCMEQAHVSDTRILYRTSPLGNTLTYKFGCRML